MRHLKNVLKKEAIAIVGMSGKYPDASHLTQFWDNLVEGKNAIRKIPPERWHGADSDEQSSATRGKIYCQWLGVLDEIEYFDPLFFHLSPAEAEVMDPQQRLFLEEGYKAFEDAGYSPLLLSNSKCGVYLGIMSHEYDLLLHERSASGTSLLGTSFAAAAARLAYHLNLKGPALAIDTACSSSLVAMHLACQALCNREIDLALVGGVSLYLTEDSYVAMCGAAMLSPSGQCKAFDAAADGFVPGEGVGALVLKRLADAQADHDQIYGLIIASGINQDGTTNGMTAPSVNSQIDLIAGIYENAHIDAESISYVEMHGTGTKLGDPIELQALATVFEQQTPRKQYCAIGSVKTNIGHPSAAAGVASVQKVLLQMRHKKLVKSLHFEQPNPHFDFEASPFYVNTRLQDWQTTGANPRRAAVSSFGFSGTNAHLVLEEYRPSPHLGASPAGLLLFVLSAKSEQQLKSYAQEMKAWLATHEEQALPDIALTLQLGRQAMPYRLAIVADSRASLQQGLEAFVDNRPFAGVYIAQVKWGLSAHEARLFQEESDAPSLLRLWLQKKNLQKLAQVWVNGADLDWKLLYGQDLPYRISLPTYPFARHRYWLPACATETVQEDSREPRASLRSPSQEPTATRLLIPSWKQEEIAREPQAWSLHPEDAAPMLAPQVVLLCQLPDLLASRIQAQMASGGRCLSLASSQPRRDQRFQDLVVQLIQQMQHLLASQAAGKGTSRLLVQVVVAHREEPCLLEALAGVLKTAQQEYPKLLGQLIEVEGELEASELLTLLQENQLGLPQQQHIRYRDGKRWVMHWQESAQVRTPLKVPWKEEGCYLISGGTGGLGRLFARDIARHVQKATIILLGRSALSREQQVQLESAGKSGVHIEYHRVDVSDRQAVHALIHRVLARHGRLDGIIHAAGVLRDSLLLNKTPEEVQAVLAPKVMGVEWLDEASSQVPLDFFILCSSLSAIEGNGGQADYAAANAYLDAFAHERARKVLLGQRHGATLSINWPFWQDGGMQIEAEARLIMQEQLGVEVMGTKTGMEALYQALASGQAQVMVAHGQIGRIKQRLLHRYPGHPLEATPGEEGLHPRRDSARTELVPVQAPSEQPLHVPTDMLSETLKHMVSRLLKVRIEE
ncbi:MAG: SDR family NAD(P)-dependent oxidoreductase, partial [Chloroflexi bacterium]